MTFPDSFELPPASLYSARFPMALAYAAVMHAGQTRKDGRGTPYITHLTAVAALVWHYGLGVPAYEGELEDLVIAGLLHDVVEDGGGEERLDEIVEMFGPRVGAVVSAATDSLVADPTQKRPWRERKDDHIARVRALAGTAPDGDIRDPGACLVIACDKFHNLSGTAAAVSGGNEAFLERFNGGPDGTRWYYRTMFEALRPALPDELVEDITARLVTLQA